jgi:hypothetical protein
MTYRALDFHVHYRTGERRVKPPRASGAMIGFGSIDPWKGCASALD